MSKLSASAMDTFKNRLDKVMDNVAMGLGLQELPCLDLVPVPEVG